MENAILGARIREARKKRKLTQGKLAEMADIGETYLSEIERGIKLPSMSVFIKLVEALGVSADYLLRDTLTSGRDFVLDDLTRRMEKLTPAQRKTAADILDAYLKNL